MRGMTRRLPMLVAVIATFLAVEPVLHQHPLSAKSDAAAATSTTCVVCAAGVHRLPNSAPAIVAPEVVVYALVAIVTVSPTCDVAMTLPSRAPPAA